MLAIGVMIWLGSELMFFSGLFAALFTIRAHLAAWPPVGTKLDTLQAGVFTVILVASSFTMQYAVWLIENRRRREADDGSSPRWSGHVVHLQPGVRMDALRDSLVHELLRFDLLHHDGLHGLHVFLGLVAMGFLLFRMRGTEGDPGELSTFQGVSYYWHFVDVVWIGLYSALFLLK